MLITTLDLDSGDIQNLDVSLRRLAHSTRPLEAACWRMILELVVNLQSRTDQHNFSSHIFGREISLYPLDPADTDRLRQAKEFMEAWNFQDPDHALRIDQFHAEYSKRFPRLPKMSINITIDWKDYGFVRAGLPEMHYRFRIQRPGQTRSEDLRFKDSIEAASAIHQLFGL